MAIEFPTFQQIVNRSRSDIAKQLPEVDPTVFGSFARAFADSQSGRAYDIVLLLQQLVKQVFPQTADGEFLELWAEYEGLTRIAASVASGNVVFSGTAATVIPIDTLVASAAGDQYKTKAEATIEATSVSISSLTRSGDIVTAVTTSDHKLASNISAIIAGANETDYNGTFTITVTDTDEFTYNISATPSSPATGTITASHTGASVNVESLDAGSEQSLDAGAKLTLVSPITGVDASAYVDFSTVSGGADIETDASLLARVLQSRANPVANFNEAAITKEALKVAGVTRVKVKRITPDIGDVTILFVRDDDTNIIPDAGEVTAVFDAIYAISPVNTPASSVIVTAPTPVTTDFTFTAISPDTSTMRSAITNTLEAFYRDSVTFETDITEDKYRSAIIDTIDPTTGDELLSFTLSSPSGDITVSTDEIGILGDIIFP